MMSIGELRNNKFFKTGFYALTYILLGMVIGSLGPTLPRMADNLGTNPDDLGFVFIARGLGWCVSSFAGGFIFDRFPGHPVMVICIITLALASFAVPFTLGISQWLWAADFVVMGVVGGLVDVGVNTLVGFVHGADLGPHIQTVHLGFGIGALVSPIIIAQVILGESGLQWSWWSLSFYAVPCLILSVFLKSPERKKLEVADKEQDTIEHEGLIQASEDNERLVVDEQEMTDLQADNKSPTNSSEEEKDTAVTIKDATATNTSSGKPVPKKLVILISTLLFLYVGAEVGFGGWLSSYALALGLADEASAPYLNTAFFGSLAFGRLLGVPLSTRVRPIHMLLVDIIGCTVASIFLTVFQASSICLWIGSAGYGLFMGSIWAGCASYPGALGMHVSAKDTMWFVVGSSIGEMALPFAMGPIFSHVGYWTLPLCLVIFTVGQLALIIAVCKVHPTSTPAKNPEPIAALPEL